MNYIFKVGIWCNIPENSFQAFGIAHHCDTSLILSPLEAKKILNADSGARPN